jgi:hypothetical protein
VKNGKFCSHLTTYFKRHIAFRNKRMLSLCETTQDNIQDWLEADPGFQLLVFL